MKQCRIIITNATIYIVEIHRPWFPQVMVVNVKQALSVLKPPGNQKLDSLFTEENGTLSLFLCLSFSHTHAHILEAENPSSLTALVKCPCYLSHKHTHTL